MQGQLERLNARDHGDLRLGGPVGAGPHFVQAVTAEFTTAAAVCPLFLTKSADTGQFYAGAMFGFEPGENLLDEISRALFAPLDLARQGFFVIDDDLVAIDPGHPRFAAAGGARLFEADGEPSQALRRVQQAMARLRTGLAETDTFIQALLARGLVEPIDVDLSFDDGRTLSLNGLYTVSLDKLGELDEAAVLDLFRRGHLQLIYAMAGSLKQVSRLAARRNDQISA
jgi:hypothetical protein